MSFTSQLSHYVDKALRELQESGYIIPENADFEVGNAINITARNIAERAEKMMQPKQYVLINGKFYSIPAIKEFVAPKELK